jgi:hypothetical protein
MDETETVSVPRSRVIGEPVRYLGTRDERIDRLRSLAPRR